MHDLRPDQRAHDSLPDVPTGALVMRIKPFRIPKYICLPGLRIAVLMRAHDDEEIEGCKGTWDYDPDTKYARIRINETLSIKQQRYILLHELQHVIADYLGCAIDPRQKHSRYFEVC
jgi:hypothetical protein